MSDPVTPPEKYWHCAIRLAGKAAISVTNDHDFEEIKRLIVDPWNFKRTFAVSGLIVRPESIVEEIKIVQSELPWSVYANNHDRRVKENGRVDMVTNRRMLCFKGAKDWTFELLFSGDQKRLPIVDLALIVQVCSRLPQTAKVLLHRGRKSKPAFLIEDEYDVQDLLHGVLRSVLKYAVQEDPLPRVASAKHGRVDLSIEELGILIEVKYVHGPNDQKRILEELSEDLLLYATWKPIKTLIYLIYNSSDLKDAEAFEKLNTSHEISGTRFEVVIVLA